MADADGIRRHCMEFYIEPARRRGDCTVPSRACDAAKVLRAHGAAVCGALGAETFDKLARVGRLSVDGTLPGVSTLFVFRPNDVG